MRVTYPGRSDAPTVAQALETQLSNVLYDVVAEEDGTVCAFIYKSSFENIRKSLSLPGEVAPMSVEAAVFAVGAGQSHTKAVQKILVEIFQKKIGLHSNNMSIKNSVEFSELTAEQVLLMTKGLSDSKYGEFVMNAILKQTNKKDLSSLEEARKLSGRRLHNVVYLSHVRELAQVQSVKVFKDTWKQLQVTIHDTKLLSEQIPRLSSGGLDNKVSLQTFLTYKQLNQSISLFIPGTSRVGKTELAKVLCMDLACRYQQTGQEEASFIIVNTLDCLRSSQACMQPGVPVLLDDIGNGDDNEPQLIYSSVGMWKAILQVPNPSQSRARNDDLMWAPRQTKIVTTNCPNLTNWIDTMFRDSADHHKQAIRMRIAEVESITESLYAKASAPSGSDRFVEATRNSEEVDNVLSTFLD